MIQLVRKLPVGSTNAFHTRLPIRFTYGLRLFVTAAWIRRMGRRIGTFLLFSSKQPFGSPSGFHASFPTRLLFRRSSLLLVPFFFIVSVPANSSRPRFLVLFFFF